MRESLAPGRLVVVNGFASRRGRNFNDKYGIVRDGETREGRLAVEIIAGFRGNEVSIVQNKPPFSLNSVNVNAMDDVTATRVGYRARR